MNTRIHLAAVAACAVVAPVAANNSSQAFNPKISLILQGSYADYSASSEAEMPGVISGPETEFRPAGFSLGETELAIEANVDHRFHGWATLALEEEDGETHVALEEAYIDTLTLPAGLALKFGRMFSDIGYHNRLHGHAWDFVDAPLAYRALLANGYGDDGLQLRWVAPTALLLEFGAEAFRGSGFPAGGEDRDGVNAWTGFVKLGGDVGTGGAWQLGLSRLSGDASERITGEEEETSFTGESDVTIIDAVYKWAPQGNATERSLVLQAEFLQRDEEGEVVSDPEGAAASSRYQGDQQGWYLQAVYGFMRHWRLGLRYGQLRSDNRLDNPSAAPLLANLADDQPERISLMLDYSPSEFSRLRLQFSRDTSRPEEQEDEQLTLQYIHSLGAHPAHQF